MEETRTKSTCALVVIDVQNEFLSTKGNFPISNDCKPNLVKNLKNLIPQFRQSGGHVIWVQAIYKNRTEEPARMKEQTKGNGILGNNEWLTVATHVFPTPCCEAGSFGAQIYPEVFTLAAPDDAVVTKGGYSAFNESTALLEALRERKVTNVYFCGVASGTCVLATVLDAVKLGDLQVHVVPDCMGWRRYNTHEAAIARFQELKVNLINSSEVELTTSSPWTPPYTTKSDET
ncbi:Isochorismatase hydrolase [Mollisia scopiformis]|uniref:Isochorismatase hydrolase n=1 Tax=Mollisia scopiformis TaxID=149040 RepID=A0A132BB48_MOLSC|nr:Isochorismatase hydrolase [Mollisia scopiformis]KUJ08887.1 Isochorismatase hydrolase [Mollisia scopiformis]